LGSGETSELLGVHDLEGCICDSCRWVGVRRHTVGGVYLYVLEYIDSDFGGVYGQGLWETMGGGEGEGEVEVHSRDLVDFGDCFRRVKQDGSFVLCVNQSDILKIYKSLLEI